MVPKHVYVFARCQEGCNFEEAVREYEENIRKVEEWVKKYKEYFKKFLEGNKGKYPLTNIDVDMREIFALPREEDCHVIF